MKGARIKYSEEELDWVSTHREMPRIDMAAAFSAKFGRNDVTVDHIKGLCTRKGWSAGPAGRSRNRGKSLIFTKEQVAWLKSNATLAHNKTHAAFCKAFPDANITATQIISFRKNHKLKTGRTGRFTPGQDSWNKGKSVPFNANSAKTRFKKGNRTGRANQIYKPIGTERLSKEGYVERKMHDGMPLQSRWRAVHLIHWEEAHGPIPEGHCLKCLDGDKSNTAPTNWKLIPRAMLPRLNGRFGRGYDDAPPELKPLILATAELEHKAREVKKGGAT